MRIRSVYSRRTVPTQRSANEFARGACGGVLITPMSTAVNTASKAAVNLLSLSRSRNRSPAARPSRSSSRFLACWATQAPGRMGGHPDDVYLTGGDLNEEQHVDPLEQHCIDREEVASQHRLRLSGQELLPGRPSPPRRRLLLSGRVLQPLRLLLERVDG